MNIKMGKQQFLLAVVLNVGVSVALQAESLIGPSFADLDIHYRHTAKELKGAIASYTWGEASIDAFNAIEECTRNGVVSSALCGHLDTFVRLKIEHAGATGLEKEILDRAYSDVLSRSSYALVCQLSTSIEQIICRLDAERSYWLWCQDHSWKYFLSKSPLSWFSGPKQAHQISENLYAIEQMSVDLYQKYGCLLRHKAEFAQCNNASHRYVWAEKTIKSLCSVVSYELLSFSHGGFFAQSVCQLNSLVDLCDRYVKTLQHRVSSLQRPSHFVRYWIPYTVATAGAMSAWYYYHQNQEAVDTFVTEKLCNEYPALIKKNFKAEVSDKVRYLVDLFLKKPAKPDIAKMRQQVVDVTQILSSVLDIFKNEGEKSLEGSIIRFEQSIAKLRAIAIQPVKVSTWAGNLELSNFQDSIKEGLEVASDLLSSVYDNVKSLHMVKIEASDKLKSLIPICESAGIDAVNKAECVTNMIDRNDVTSGMTAIFPAAFIAGVMTWAVYKSAAGFKHWLTKHDVRIIRSRLSGIHDVLITAGSSMTDEQYGKFMYCAQKLHMQAYKNVPYHHRDAFIAHLKQLASDTLGVEQKKETVTNMRATYEFLSPMFIA